MHIEKLLEFFISVVDAQLFKTVHLLLFKVKRILQKFQSQKYQVNQWYSLYH